MQQQVNLYLPEFHPRNDWLTAARLLQLVAIAIVGVLLLSGIDYGRRYLLQQEQAETQATLTEQTRITEQIERSLAGRATDQDLLDEIETREANLAQLESTLEILRTVSLGNLNGFSEHLKNLSRSSTEGLWLTDIQISEGGRVASLQGYAEHSAMVPNFVERLSTGWSNSEGWRFTRIAGDVVVPGETSTDEAGTVTTVPQVDGTLYRFQLEAQ